MQLKLSYYQFKINGYIIFYARLKLTTRGKIITDTQRIKRKESEQTTTKNHQIIKEYGKKERNKTPKERENNEQNDNNVFIYQQLLYI